MCFSRQAFFFLKVVHRFFFFVLPFVVFISSCEKPPSYGYLKVIGSDKASFELYKTLGDPPSQFISEISTKMNADIPLSPGRYIILADCSHEVIVISPGKIVNRVLHEVEFIPPQGTKEDDLFSVQCVRYQKLNFRQNVKNKFNFFVLPGKRKMLVSMTNFSLKLPGKEKQQAEKITYDLAAVKVFHTDKIAIEEPYFVSPSIDQISLTQSQKINKAILLLPGEYDISINGTTQKTLLNSGDYKAIELYKIKFTSSSKVDLSSITRVVGDIPTVKFDGEHLMNLNEYYYVLPGERYFQLPGSLKKNKINLEDEKNIVVPLKSVLLDQHCIAGAKGCSFGKRGVELYLQGTDYPYLESVTDIPILYYAKKVSVGLLSSQGIRYALKSDRDIQLSVGHIKFIPKLVYEKGQVTDLARLEANGKHLSGYSFDITSRRPTTLSVIAGGYKLVSYRSSLYDYNRGVSERLLKVKAGETVEVEFPFYVTKYQLKRFIKDSKKLK